MLAPWAGLTELETAGGRVLAGSSSLPGEGESAVCFLGMVSNQQQGENPMLLFW